MDSDTIKEYVHLLFMKARIRIPFYIFAADTMWENVTKTSRISYPIAIIQNTDKISQRGKHWLAWFVLSATESEFFDSYGNSIRKYKYVQKPTKLIVLENCISIQSPTSYLCGPYCIYYIYLRSLGIPYSTIMDTFTQSVSSNDFKIEQFMRTNSDVPQEFCYKNIYNPRCQSNICQYLCRDFY